MYNNISNDAKTALKSRVVTTTARITLTSNNQVIDGNNLVNVTITDQCYQDGVIVGTAMAKEVEIELINNNYDLADKEFSLEVGVLLPNNSYEYIPYGNFIVKDYQKIISSNHYRLIAYDYMDKFNATFVDNNPTLEDGVTYTTPMTLQSFYQYVANQFGVTIETQSNLPNANFSITTKPYLEGLSGRNVLSRIAEMMGCFAKINRSNKIEMRLKTTTSEKFSRNEMNNSLERDNRFGPINVISLRLSQVEGENVTKRDESSISQYGETTLQIQDNPFCYTEALRLAAINAIYNKVDGFSYYPTTFNGKLIYLDAGDEVEVQDMETDTYYKTIILKQVLKIPSTRNSKFENKALTNVGLEHQFTPEQVRKDRRTEYLVDKQNGVIQQIVETTEEIEREFETLQDIDGFAEGKYIYLDDASDELITSAKFNGETRQENTPTPDNPSEIENIEGRNIFDEVLENGGFDTNGINGANAARIRSKNYISIKENTSYTISVGENNTGKTLQVSMSFYDTNDYVTSRISHISWTTLNKSVTFTTPSNCKYMRFLISYTDGSNITINDDFNKFMIKKGTDIIPYAPYNSLEVKVINKNLLGLPNIAETTALGLQYSVNNGEITLNGTATSGGRISIPLITPIQCVNGTNYTLSKEATGTASNHGFNVQLRNAGSNIKNYTEAQLPQSFDNISSFINELGLYIGNGYSFTNYKLKLQLEQGVATEYEENQEQTVYFPLAEGQKLYKGSYLADDGIHNVRGQVILDGSNDEDWTVYAVSDAFSYTYVVRILGSAVGLQKSLCSHFKNVNYTWVNTIGKVGQYCDHPSSVNKYFNTDKSTLALWKAWLQSNPITVEYELPEEEIIPYNTEQQAAWNSIRELHTYKTVTHIYSDAYAEIGYIKDNMLSAFETKASAQLTKNDVSQLKIENGRISSEVSSTQSQFNNYYTKNEADNNTNSTKAELQNIIQQNKTEVEQTTQALNLRVSSIETNGVDKIETSMGYTFNNEGLNIDKEGAATASTIDNEAFKVKNKSANENVFFAGYVSDQDSAYRGQTIVESTNLVVKNYLNIEGASRFQPYVNPVLGGHGTGAFDIG